MKRIALIGSLACLGLGCGDVHTVSLGSHLLRESNALDAAMPRDAQSQDAAKPSDDTSEDDSAGGGENTDGQAGAKEADGQSDPPPENENTPKEGEGNDS